MLKFLTVSLAALVFLVSCADPEAAEYQTALAAFNRAEALYASTLKKLDRVAFSYLPNTCNGRLTTQSNNAISTANRTAQGTIYFTPYQGNRVTLFSEGRWQIYAFTQLSLGLGSGLLADNNYDVFLYDSGSALALEFSAAWSSATTRAQPLELFQGVWVKQGDRGRRYLGTIRTVTDTTTEDSATRRFVWNHANRVAKRFSFVDTTNTWTYAGTAWQQAGLNAANTFEFVLGMKDVLVSAHVHGGADAAGLAWATTGIGVDSTTSNSAVLMGGSGNPTVGTTIDAEYFGYPGVGYHTLNWVETTDGSGTITFWGDNGSNRIRSGMEGWFKG